MTGTTRLREDDAIADVVRRLQVRFGEHDPEHVRDVVHSHRLRMDGARIRTYVPVLVEHASRAALGLAHPPRGLRGDVLSDRSAPRRG